MNKKQRQEVSDVFYDAIDDLWDGHGSVSGYERGQFQEQFICYILDANTDSVKLYNTSMRAKKIITDRLEGCNTLEEWLMTKGVPESDLTDENVQAHRIEWLYMLHYEFSEEL